MRDFTTTRDMNFPAFHQNSFLLEPYKSIFSRVKKNEGPFFHNDDALFFERKNSMAVLFFRPFLGD